jgi:hypothetical protein
MNTPTLLTLTFVAAIAVTCLLAGFVVHKTGSTAGIRDVLDRLAFNDSNRSYYGGLFGVYAVQFYCPQHQANSGFNGDY